MHSRLSAAIEVGFWLQRRLIFCCLGYQGVYFDQSAAENKICMNSRTLVFSSSILWWVERRDGYGRSIMGKSGFNKW